ncbi:MAG TPA: TIR domain-containing protein, partial [Xanthobacteraceae bacterium]|nr:TIR domain-containing protein [Xanthobacteraceae bacterium]
MAKIAISYRRSDSQDITGRIFDRLVQHYGKSTVFRDIDNIQPGIDFRIQIAEALRTTDVLLVIVGPRWFSRIKGIENRIDNEADPVRIEVEIALKREIPIIPVLVGGMRMPEVGQLPASLRDFSYRHAVTVDSARDFDYHVDGLIGALDRILTGRQAESVEQSTRHDSAQPASALSATPVHSGGIAGKIERPQPPRILGIRNYWLAGGLAVIALALALIVFRDQMKGPIDTPQALDRNNVVPMGSAVGVNSTAYSNANEAERAWAVTKDVTSIAVLNDFIRQFGDTPYGSMARARVQELQKSQMLATAQPVAPPPQAPPITQPSAPPAQVHTADIQTRGSPSFDCTRVHAPDELEICRNGELSYLDWQLDILFSALRSHP